jgi:hypothetical protein
MEKMKLYSELTTQTEITGKKNCFPFSMNRHKNKIQMYPPYYFAVAFCAYLKGGNMFLCSEWFSILVGFFGLFVFCSIGV